MTYLAKPRLHHPELPKNKLGFTHRDYEGTVSTLCAGCGHDSISGAIIQAFTIPPSPFLFPVPEAGFFTVRDTSNPPAVPEPTALILLLTALLGFVVAEPRRIWPGPKSRPQPR